LDFGLAEGSKPEVNRTLFREYRNSIFVLSLTEVREMEEFEACAAVVLIDNASNHMSDHIVAILTHERVRIVTFGGDTTHICQMLDVVLFRHLEETCCGSWDAARRASGKREILSGARKTIRRTVISLQMLSNAYHPSSWTS
jgi:hypothetical protein